MTSLPSLYEYYTAGGINSGLKDYKNAFFLNGKEFAIYGGSMDYFRVQPAYWKNRIQKMKAAGLNTVTTNVPWNLHEPSPGMFEFGNYMELLDVVKFLHTVQEEDMFAIVRPGPFIGADVDFGGLPSWLLREEGIKMRTNDNRFMLPVRKYLNALFAILITLQFVKGGPIIAFEIETNDHLPESDISTADYASNFKKIYFDNGIVEMLFSSGLDTKSLRTNPADVLWALKVNAANLKNFQQLKILQNDRPTFVIEYQSGLAQRWSEIQPTISCLDFGRGLHDMMAQNTSFNIHMFHGGSNFGFISGSGITNSYDYDAPLSESGDYTEKYFLVQSILHVYGKINVKTPERPKFSLRTMRRAFNITNQVKLGILLDNMEPAYKSKSGVVPMELLPTNNNSGQSYGFIVYRTRDVDVPMESKIKIFGTIHDSVTVLVNGKIISKPIAYGNPHENTNLTITSSSNEATNNATLDIIVESFGRSQSFQQLDIQYKGLWEGNVTLNGNEILNWDVYSLDFKEAFLDNITGWNSPELHEGYPSFNQGSFEVYKLSDAFLDMRNWRKGVVVINGFVLSKYSKGSPQQTIYIPAPLLKQGSNQVVIFEQFAAHSTVNISKNPNIDSNVDFTK